MSSHVNNVLVIKTNRSGFQEKPLIVVIGKAVSKKAVIRNLIKRRIMVIMRPIMKKIGADITIIVRKGAEGRHIRELKEEIERIIKI